MASQTVSRKRPKGKTRMARFAPHLPYEDFPLFPLIDRKTGAGRWAKKIRKTLHYFGSIADGWEKAFERFNKEAPYLLAGRAVPANPDDMTVADLCNHFYAAKEQRHAAGEITARTLGEYDATCKTLIKAFSRNRIASDLAAQDFAKLREDMTKRCGLVRLVNEITRVRGVFKFAFDNNLIDTPIRFGSEFARPSSKALRLHRAKKGERLFEASELRGLIDAAGVQVRAMILLGINAGLGNTDISELNQTHLDLSAKVMDYPRPKTGIHRRAILWPETIAAIKAALKARPAHSDPNDADAVFVTKYGRRWATGSQSTAVGLQFTKLLKAEGINRDGASFYAIRHTFRTIADAAGDQRAANRIMGHEPAHISGHYVERIEDERLETEALYAHRWLFSKPAKGKIAGAK